MEVLNILKKDGTSFHDIFITEYDYSEQRMGDVQLSASFNFSTILDNEFTGDEYVVFRQNKYYIRTKPQRSKNNESVLYKYDVTFVSEQSILKNILYTDVVVQGEPKYYSGDTSVMFTGNITEFVSRLNASLEKNMPNSGWRAILNDGVTSDYKDVSFEGQYFWNVLQQMYEIYKIPFIIQNKTIYIGEVTHSVGYTFKYGQNNGLYSITKASQNNKIITKITGHGSSDNIPYRYPNIQDVETKPYLMPKIYRDSSGITSYYESANINPTYPQQGEKHFEDIKPSIVGATYLKKPIDEILSVAFDPNDNDNVNNETGEVEHPYFKITLNPMGFDLYGHASANGTMTLSMKSGACAGCSFEVQGDWDNIAGNNRDYEKYPDSTNVSITLTVKKDINTFGTLLPSAKLKPKTADKFVILYIDLPNSYVLNAEKKLEDELIKYMAENDHPKFNYTCGFDEKFLTENPDIESQLTTNSKVVINDNNTNIDLFIKSISIRVSENSILPKYTITLSDAVEVVKSPIDDIKDKTDDIVTVVRDNEIKGSKGLRENQKAINKAMGAVFDSEGNNRIDTVEALAIKTNAIQIGQNVNDFALDRAKITYNNGTLTMNSGSCLHNVLNWGITDTTESSWTWNIAQKTVTSIDTTKTHFIYIQANRNNNSAIWLISTQQLVFDTFPTTYLFLWGQLIPINDTMKLISTFGISNIMGGKFSGHLLESPNYDEISKTGMQIDLIKATMTGKINFRSGSTGLKNMVEYGDVAEKDDFAQQLGYPDYASLAAEAMKGNTIIDGGIIRTSLLDTNSLFASQAFIDSLSAGNLTVKGNIYQELSYFTPKPGSTIRLTPEDLNVRISIIDTSSDGVVYIVLPNDEAMEGRKITMEISAIPIDNAKSRLIQFSIADKWTWAEYGYPNTYGYPVFTDGSLSKARIVPAKICTYDTVNNRWRSNITLLMPGIQGRRLEFAPILSPLGKNIKIDDHHYETVPVITSYACNELGTRVE